MDILGLSLRAACVNNGLRYRPFSLGVDGIHSIQWTPEETTIVEAAFAGKVPTAVSSMFNNWCVWKHSPNFFTAKRATWDMGIFCANSAREIADKIVGYYKDKDES